MRRSEILAGAENIVNAIDKSNLQQVIRAHMREKSDALRARVALLSALRSYSLSARDFGPTERSLLEIFDLDAIDAAEYWARLLSEEAPESSEAAHHLYLSINFAVNYLPRIIRLMQTEASALTATLKLEARTATSEFSLLTTILPEEGTRSTPARLAKLLNSITLLYEMQASINEAPEASLSVIGCDSGSDKSFDFLGLANVVTGVKEILLGVWDRVVFYRERKVEVWLKLLTESLPVVEQISTLATSKKIGPEQAELLKRKVIEGVSGFIEVGAFIPEIQERSHFNPRQILAPSPKLLTAAPGHIEEDALPELPRMPAAEDIDAESEIDIENLTTRERATLQRLLKKTKKIPSK
jgi:hypothetical protein